MRVHIPSFKVPPPWVIEKEKSRRHPADERQPAHLPVPAPEYCPGATEDQQNEGRDDEFLVSLN